MNSYPKIYNVGHPALDGFFKDTKIVIEEKIDGSQFSFGKVDGVLHTRSKRADVFYGTSAGMFSYAMDTVMELEDKLIPGWIYRAEYLAKPKHNALSYSRTPKRHLILFDIATEPERYIDRATLESEAKRLDLEVVPVLAEMEIESIDAVKGLLNTASILGGQKVEGLVFKRRRNPLWGRDSKPLIAKHVSEQFREVHRRDFKRENKADILGQIIMKYCSMARWQKAIMSMREVGTLLNEPRDIGQLIQLVQQDVTEECQDEIKTMLYEYYRKQIMRGVIRGLPEWYKDQLLEGQFNE